MIKYFEKQSKCKTLVWPNLILNIFFKKGEIPLDECLYKPHLCTTSRLIGELNISSFFKKVDHLGQPFFLLLKFYLLFSRFELFDLKFI